MSFPNYLTILRIIICPFFFTALVSYESDRENYRLAALFLFLLAALTDAVDGFLARLLKQKTRLGIILDPLADKLLLLSGYLGILGVQALQYHPPLWITVAIVFRDLVILGGLIVLLIATGRVNVQPNKIGKLATVFQMLTLVAILLQAKLSVPLWNLTAFLTILSGVMYVARDLRLLRLPVRVLSQGETAS